MNRAIDPETRILVEANNLCRTYRTSRVETHAVNRVCLKISEGDFLVLQGPSGCGKSSLLRTLALLEKPTSGELRVAGKDVNQLKDANLARLRNLLFGYIFQNNNLLPELTVIENVMLPLSFYRGMTRHEMKERALEALAQVNLLDRLDHFPHTLSGGQQQRAAIARALINEPKLIFADEPTGNLDRDNGERVMALLAAANLRGTAVCLVTHEAAYSKFATRHLRMLDGTLIS